MVMCNQLPGMAYGMWYGPVFGGPGDTWKFSSHVEIPNFCRSCSQMQVRDPVDRCEVPLPGAHPVHRTPLTVAHTIHRSVLHSLDQIAKPLFRSRYVQTPFGSASVSILLSKKVIAIFVMRLHHHVNIM